MERTERQVAADDALHAAIDEAINAYEAGPGRDGYHLSDWVVAYVLETGEDDKVFYGQVVPGAGVPTYRSVGLLVTIGRQLLNEGWEED